MAWTIHNSALARMLEEHLNGATPPNPNKFYLILTNGTVITNISTIAQVTSAELPASNGYHRMNYNPSAGNYDSAQSRYEAPLVTASITATGGAIQYDTVVLISDANPTIGEAVGNIEVFQVVGSTTIPAGATQSFIVSFNAGGSGVDLSAA